MSRQGEPTPTELIHQLHQALYGKRSPARSDPPKVVWEELLADVRRLRNAHDRLREALYPLVDDAWPDAAPFIETFMERADWQRARAALGDWEPTPTVADMAGLFESGPDSVEWLRRQRGGDE